MKDFEMMPFRASQLEVFKNLGLKDVRRTSKKDIAFSCPVCERTLHRKLNTIVGSKNYKCEHCQEDKRAQEAKDVGLVLLGEAQKEHSCDPKNYRHYLLPCGHKDDLQVTHVRRNNWKCETCTIEEYSKRCDEVNMTFVSRIEGSQKLKVQYNNCKHFTEVYPHSLVGKTLKHECKDCYEERIQKRLAEDGLRIIDRYFTGRYSRIFGEFINCRHTKDFAIAHLLTAKVECKECIYDKIQEEAESQGCDFIRIPTPDPSKNIYKMHCGCIKEFRRDHLRNGRWACWTCGINHYAKPSILYLLRISYEGISWLKFGYSAHMSKRIYDYGLPKGSRVEILKAIYTETGDKSHIAEVKIHRELKDLRLDKNVMKTWHLKSGKTECYPLVLEDYIIKRMEEELYDG